MEVEVSQPLTLNISLLWQHNASRHSTPQSPQVASVVVREHGPQIFGRVQEEDDSNVENQLAHENAPPKSHGLQLEAVRALIASRGSFRPVGHLRVAGCKTRVAIEHHCVWHTNFARSNEKLPLAIAVVPDHLTSYEAGILSRAWKYT